jgi:hypothetical protein
MKIEDIFDLIYTSKDLSSEIIRYYDKVDVKITSVTRVFFELFYKRNRFQSNPSILFDFFDTKHIKIAVFPVLNTEFWSSRIYLKDEIILINDYNSRMEATIGALERAIKIYKEKNENKPNY